MNRYFRHLPIFFGTLLSITAFASPQHSADLAELQFFQGTLSQLKTKAQIENKPYLIYFYTDWCEPCQDLQEETLGNMRVSQYLNDHYLTFRIDAEILKRGEEALADEFEVDLFPTVLIFGEAGNLIHQFSGFKDPGELLGELKTFYFENSATPLQALDPETEETYPDRMERDETFVKHSSGKATDAYSRSLEEPEWKKKSPSSHKIPRGDGLFKMNIMRHNSDGFAVQVGVFKEYQNAIFKMEQCKSYFDQQMLLNVNSLQKEPVFKVMYGPFSSMIEAKAFMREYKQASQQAAVLVDLSWFKKPID
ncbi:MAG: thioredoxin family protein [Bacteroidota bacterium]